MKIVIKMTSKSIRTLSHNNPDLGVIADTYDMKIVRYIVNEQTSLGNDTIIIQNSDNQKFIICVSLRQYNSNKG